MISIPLNYEITDKKTITITFKDSMLLLSGSLRNLANSFGVESKSYFPFKFVNNTDVDLNYVGEIPSFDLWKDINIEEYNSLEQDNWSLKKETIKYCQQDCITIHQILVKFNTLIHGRWSVNINKYPTLPSLAFAIYRSNYMPNNVIPKLTGQIYNDISKGYTGGHVDVYIPKAENANHYDVNSLYPFVMSNFPSPVGPIHEFDGNIFNYEPDAFGFFYCKIKTVKIDGKDMDRPLAQTRIQTPNGIRTVAPLGEWTDWMFSEEIKKYQELGGYEFTIYKGYTFGKLNIFESYVNDMYSIKNEYSNDKSNPMYLISKLLMNSLYGRFGMKTELPSHKIINDTEIGSFRKKYINLKVDPLGNGRTLITFYKPKSNSIKTLWHDWDIPNVNVAISASITAYARAYMAIWLADPKFTIIYIDTDCLVMIQTMETSPDLGAYKLENIYPIVVF